MGEMLVVGSQVEGLLLGEGVSGDQWRGREQSDGGKREGRRKGKMCDDGEGLGLGGGDGA